MYFTEDEPPVRCIGNGKHWWGKPSQRGFNLNLDAQSQQFNTGVPLANTKADDFVMRNQGLVSTIKSVGEQL